MNRPTFYALAALFAMARMSHAQEFPATPAPVSDTGASAIGQPASAAISPECLLPYSDRPGGTIQYAPTAGLIATPYGFLPCAPSVFLFGGGIVGPPPIFPAPTIWPQPVPPFGLGPPGLMLPRPDFRGANVVPQIVVVPEREHQQDLQAAAARPARRNTERASELMTFGDRLFRADHLVRATSRYKQALQADPFGASPRIRLSQVALRRGEYREAANLLREAITAEPGWLINAQNIQAIYAEPADFHDLIAKIETHLQAHPDDRDAWLLLGAQLYLSRRAERAADIFLRLTDRPPDSTLSAFLEATRAQR